MMKAVVQDEYGAPDAVLKLRDVPKPVAKDHEVLVRVRAASVHVDVWSAVAGQPRWIRLLIGFGKPRRRIPGTDLAGQVESIGKHVRRFKPGDDVFGLLSAFANGGSYAEYAAVPQDLLANKPHNVTFEQAATVPFSGHVALGHLARAGTLKAGQQVLINGAGGAVGSIAVQIVKAAGAHVTGVDCAEKLAMIRALGADRVVDFRQQDVTRGNARYDFILDVASTLSFDDCKRVLTPTGIYWLAGHPHFGPGMMGMSAGVVFRAPFDRHLPGLGTRVPSTKEAMVRLRELLESGALAPIVARTFPLSEAGAALRYFLEQRAPGRIVIAP